MPTQSLVHHFISSLVSVVAAGSERDHRILNRQTIDTPKWAKGSGWCVQQGEHKYVITNFHVIKTRSKVTVRRSDLSRAYEGVVFEATPIWDLAVITVEDPEFWAKMTYPPLNTQWPRTGDLCYCVGFGKDPLDASGYSRLRITQGCVGISRMTYVNHMLEEVEAFRNQSCALTFLTMSTKGAPGMSGGCLFNEAGQVIGVPSQAAFRDGAWQGECLPAAVVHSFLATLKSSGIYEGSYALGLEDIVYWSGDSPATREFHGCSGTPPGMNLNKPLDIDGHRFKQRDRVVAIDGRPLNHRGEIQVQEHQYLDFSCLTDYMDPSHVFTLKFLLFETQTCQEVRIEPVILRFSQPFRELSRESARYAILGGYLFFDVNQGTLTELLMNQKNHGHPFYYGPAGTKVQRLASKLFETYRKGQRGLLLYRSLLSHESTQGNIFQTMSLVLTINDKRVKKLETLVKLATSEEGPPFLLIRCTDGRTVCIERSRAFASEVRETLDVDRLYTED